MTGLLVHYGHSITSRTYVPVSRINRGVDEHSWRDEFCSTSNVPINRQQRTNGCTDIYRSRIEACTVRLLDVHVMDGAATDL